MVRAVNAAALAIADISEGCVLHVYLDPRGIRTAGYGHVVDQSVAVGTPVTQEEADAWRAADMARAATFVEAHVKVPLSDNQFSALAELTYNIGVGNFLGSTLLRLLNRGQYESVPAQLALWVHAGGKVEPGLVTRRAREAVLFTTPDTHTVTISPVATIVPVAVTPPPAVQPSAPSLIERIRAWFHRNAKTPS